MRYSNALDALVQARLRTWPQRPPGIPAPTQGPGRWLRARPAPEPYGEPYLKLPGSQRLRTLPDGLWLKFGGAPGDPYVDAFVIEACGSMPNLQEKRARFAPSTHALLVCCPTKWLLGAVSADEPEPRWTRTGLLSAPPDTNLTLPVRDLRVLYALKPRQFQDLAQHQVLHAHEYFMPMNVLVGENATEDPAVCALLARATSAANFLSRG